MDMIPIPAPSGFSGEVMFLDQFLGLVDDIEDAGMFADFLKYESEGLMLKTPPITSTLDKYGSFKDSHGVLVQGAQRFDYAAIDLHWGTKVRFETLIRFWSKFPRVGAFGHPRSWKLSDHPSTLNRLMARSYFGWIIFDRIGDHELVTTSPFEELSFDQGQISNLLMEILADSVQQFTFPWNHLGTMLTSSVLHVIFFPKTIVESSEKFNHLKSLIPPPDSDWKIDAGYIDHGIIGIRVIFNEARVRETLLRAKDSTFPVSLIEAIIRAVDFLRPNPEILEDIEMLRENSSKPVRFMMFEHRKDVSFPEFSRVHSPEPYDRKSAHKRVAELARQIGLQAGTFSLTEGRDRLNSLRQALVAEINKLVEQYNFTSAILFLITEHDSIDNKYDMEEATLKASLRHEIEFDRNERMAEAHNEHYVTVNNVTYLIEKFIEITPTGKKEMRDEDFRYLFCLVDEVHGIYQKSDIIQYQVYPTELIVNDDYTFDVKYSVNLEQLRKAYADEQAGINLGTIGNQNDRVASPRPIEDFLQRLDAAYQSDLGFGLRNLVGVLKVLSVWSSYAGVPEATVYSSNIKKIIEVCENGSIGVSPDEVAKILAFLTLQKESVKRIEGDSNICEDLPVWEHAKRIDRYNLKPLILMGDNYYWGPFSARGAGVLWSDTPFSLNFFPNGRSSKIRDVSREEKELIESALVDRTYEIVLRHTNQEAVEKEVYLHKRDKQGKHPENLGDYDVLAFLPLKNVILNIECKDILPAHSLKDSMRVRKKIFGSSKNHPGYLSQVEKRYRYLEHNTQKMASVFRWPIDTKNPPKIISLYVSRRSHWWIKFPPKKTDIVFKRVDCLDEFISSIN